MSTPQIIISLSPQGELVTELPGLNGSRRKINLGVNQNSNYAIGNALQVLNDIANIEAIDTADLLSQLQNKITSARDAVNQLSSFLNKDNTTTDIIFRILENQQANKNQIGEDGNPTEQQVKHWQKHGFICEDENCKLNKKGITHSHSFSDPSCAICIGEGRFEPGKNREDTRKLRGLTEYEAMRCGLISRGFVQSKNNKEIWTKKNMAAIFLLSNGIIKNHKQIHWSKEERQSLIQDGKNHAKIHGFVPLETFKKQGIVVKKQAKMVKETQAEKLRRKVGTLTF